MIYNKEKKRIFERMDCLSCKYFDRKTQECSGINKNCFEYDPKTNTVIDGVTKTPIKFEKETK